ncbi:MAG TPA: sigma-54 dependent transcriptional regulator [Gammaproteobacteria bacterium]
MATRSGRILVVDDDHGVLTAAKLLLKRHFAVVQTESDPTRIEALLALGFDVVLLDMNFALGANTGAEGFEWLKRILSIDPAIVVILMTAYGDVDTAVKAIKSGATDFVLKPWQNEKLIATVTAALRLHESRAEVEALRQRNRELGTGRSSDRIIGESAAMARVHALVRRAAPTDANVLILGEAGTGKELIARAVHEQSARAREVFLSVDLGAVSEHLFESELFGHKRGAFTDARDDRAGRFQAASGGTLFLDEIGNLPLHLQGKLLRVLEERAVTPLGVDHAVPVDVRLIAATNMPLRQMCRRGEFREDLLYRINTVEIQLPPLRERTEDIPALVEHFIDVYARKYNLARKQVTPGALKRLEAHAWPGNVRELRHAVERALIMSERPVLDAHDFFPTDGATGPTQDLDLDDLKLEAVEHHVIRKVLAKHAGNVSRAARELGITRASLYRRMEKYGL